jgi:hypothetical protein
MPSLLALTVLLSGCCCLGYRQVDPEPAKKPDVVYIDDPAPLTRSQLHMIRNAHPDGVVIYQRVRLEPAP